MKVKPRLPPIISVTKKMKDIECSALKWKRWHREQWCRCSTPLLLISTFWVGTTTHGPIHHLQVVYVVSVLLVVNSDYGVNIRILLFVITLSVWYGLSSVGCITSLLSLLVSRLYDQRFIGRGSKEKRRISSLFMKTDTAALFNSM